MRKQASNTGDCLSETLSYRIMISLPFQLAALIGRLKNESFYAKENVRS